MAEQLAGLGYVAFLPEMYYRHGRYEPFRLGTVFTDAKERPADGDGRYCHEGDGGERCRRVPRSWSVASWRSRQATTF